MGRSLYKMPYVCQKLMAKWSKKGKNYDHLKVYARASTITPNFIGLGVKIHNGNRYVTLKITSKVIGYKFGSFAPTKRGAYYGKKN